MKCGKVTLILILKELISTMAVEIVVEIFASLWKSIVAISFSRFPQAIFSQSCGNVENLKLNVRPERFKPKTMLWKNLSG